MEHYNLQGVGQKVDQILTLLQGQDIDEQDEGMIGDVRKLKIRITQLERWKEKTMAWALGVAFGGGSLITWVIATILNSKK